jgi:hypothetical protein
MKPASKLQNGSGLVREDELAERQWRMDQLAPELVLAVSVSERIAERQ